MQREPFVLVHCRGNQKKDNEQKGDIAIEAVGISGETRLSRFLITLRSSHALAQPTDL